MECDYREVYAILKDLLINLKREDAVRSNEEYIEYGKLKRKKIKGKIFTAVEEYTDQEKAEIMFRSLKAFANMFDIQNVVMDFFGDNVTINDTKLERPDESFVRSLIDQFDKIFQEK